MRTRKEIETEIKEFIDKHPSLATPMLGTAILEVLLDIRDLLEKQNEPNGEPTPEENPLD